MTTIETQIHGYRQGHQLLSSSLALPKSDQQLIDRLSDVAGPLRPGEKFAPYLSAYPLPSKAYFVLARTWQDLTVPRAGCVRTLSLLIPVMAWAEARDLMPFLELLDPSDFPIEAATLSAKVNSGVPLPPTPDFRASEILEALFLEDPKPVAVFDAPSAELIMVRLLTALWPSLRARFAVSTMALSPRKIEGRNFDLVFAPKDARSKFADWPGRRIDGRAAQVARHRWTGAIVERVFNAPFPRLLDDRELEVIGSDDSKSPAALRIALLWDELLGKLETSPTAALGLLDIANSRTNATPEALRSLAPPLADAVHRAVANLPASEAWDFIGAIARKLSGSPLSSVIDAVSSASAALAAKAPRGAFALLEQDDRSGAIEVITASIARGLASMPGRDIEAAVTKASPIIVSRLVACDTSFARVLVELPGTQKFLADIVPTLEPARFREMSEALLPLLMDDAQIAVALPFLAQLDAEGIHMEVERLADADFQAASFIAPIVGRSAQLGETARVRDSLASKRRSPGRDQFIRSVLKPSVGDLKWLLNDTRLDPSTVTELTLGLLDSATDPEISVMVEDAAVAGALVRQIPDTRSDLLMRIIDQPSLSLSLYIPLVVRLLGVCSQPKRAELARKALGRVISVHFPGDELGTIASWLGIAGPVLDGRAMAQTGVRRDVESSVASRNLKAFQQASPSARTRLLGSIEHLADALIGRQNLDFDEGGAIATAALLTDARSVDPSAQLRAAGKLLPMAMRARHLPVSSIVAAAFPLVYRELAKEDDVPDLLKFIPFIDWDRCKAARRELVDAFVSSAVWKPSDLAMAACRSSDIGKILRRTAKSYRGDAYLTRLSAETKSLPSPCREQVRRAVSDIREDWSSKYDWRD